MKRVLLTGGTGFVGANLARRLLKEGHEVCLLVRPGFTEWRLKDIKNNLQFVTANLLDRPSLKPLLQKFKPDWIFHLATHGAYSSQNEIDEIMGTNILGTVQLARACAEVGFEAFINTGSSSEYGFKKRACSEQEWLEPNSYYAVSKASGTLFCRYLAQREKLPIFTFRLYSVYGAYEDPSRLFPALVLNGLKGSFPPLVDPRVGRDFVFIDDVCDAYLAAAKQAQKLEPGDVFNIGSGKQTSMKDLVSLVQREFKIKARPQWSTMKNRSWDTRNWVCNNAKVKKKMGWHPRVSIQKGLELTSEWFQSNPDLLDDVYRPVVFSNKKNK